MPADQQRHVPVTPTRSAMRAPQLPRATQLPNASQITSVLQVPQVPQVERTPQGPPHRPPQDMTEASPSPRVVRTPNAPIVHSSPPSAASNEPDGSDR